MKRSACRMAVLTLAALPACQTLPPQENVRSIHGLREEPHRAAVCVARNLDAHPGGFDSRIREGTPPALIEVRVARAQPVALAEFFVRGDGSTVEVTTTPALEIERDGFAAAILAGC